MKKILDVYDGRNMGNQKNCRIFRCYKWIRIHLYLVTLLILPLSCVTNYPKHVMEPPWVPAEPTNNDGGTGGKPHPDTKVPVYFSETDIPVIDGTFTEWNGLDGPLTRLAVYGGSHVPEDAEAFFVVRTDGINLFLYSRVSDDLPHENFLPGSMAWRGDTVEIFFGPSTTRHEKYQNGDNQIRLVPRSRENIMEVDIVINQRTVGAYMVNDQEGAVFAAAARYSESGYEIEAAIPLSLMMIEGLKPGRKVRCDFQVNDADESERDRMVHWMSEKDNPWNNPSVWGDGIVVELPETRKEDPDYL